MFYHITRHFGNTIFTCAYMGFTSYFTHVTDRNNRVYPFGKSTNEDMHNIILSHPHGNHVGVQYKC